ncbi:Fusaric acid resistance protein family protein [compost metagenome]
MTRPATLAEHRRLGVQMLDRLMQLLPRLIQTGQDTGTALRDLRAGLNLLDLLAYMPRVGAQTRASLERVVEEVGEHFQACLDARQRLHAPPALLQNMERARRALNLEDLADNAETRLQLLHALSGLRLALLPGVEVVLEPSDEPPQLPYGIDGAPL